MSIPTLSFSLRGHSESITCSCFVEDSFVTADSSGQVFWWDLNLKRPKLHWKAHDSNILSLHYITESNVLLTHSRDSTVRFWKLDPESTSAFSSSTSSSVRPHHLEFPVNALNFCNVSLASSRYLLTPSTINSNNFDIYDINSSRDLFTKDGGSLGFSRLVHDLDPWNLYQKALKTLPIPLDDDLSKRDKFGIMMKTLWVDESTFYIAYESGHILGFHADLAEKSTLNNSVTKTVNSTSLINKGPSINLFHISDRLSPSPILSLVHDEEQGNIIAGSASKMIEILPIPKKHAALTEEGSTNELVSLKYSGLSQISILKPNTICVGFWNGIVKGYAAVSGKIEEQFKLEKNLPTIDSNDENQSQRLKLTTIECRSALSTDSGATKSKKELVRARRDIKSNNLLAIGYENGLVNVYTFT